MRRKPPAHPRRRLYSHSVCFPIPLQRQQFINAAVGPGGELVQGILEPGGGVEAVELGRPQQALDHRRPLARPLGPGEQPVLLADGDRADGVLDRVVVDGQVAGLGVAGQRGPAVEGVVDGLGGPGPVGDGGAGFDEPVMAKLQPGLGVSGPQRLARLGGQARRLGLDAVEPGDVAQGAGGDRALVGLGKVEEFAPRMGHAAEFDDGAVAEQGLVARIVVDHEVSLPSAQEGRGMFAFAAGLVVEQEDRRLAVEAVAAVGPQVGFLGLAPAGVELLHRGLVGVEDGSQALQLGQPVGQGLQGDPQSPDPVRQGGQGQRDVLAGGDLRQPVQRQVVEEFTDEHPRQQAGGRHAAVDDGGRDRRGDDGFAGAAGVLRVDVAVDGELGGLDIQLLGDVLADLDQIDAAAAPALAGFGFVDVHDARQVGRQWLPPGPDARLARDRRLALLGEARQFLLDGGLVGHAVLVEQVALPGGGQRLALLAEAQSLVVGQFEGEGLDLEFGGVQCRVAQRDGLVAEGDGLVADEDGLPRRVQFGKQPVEFPRGQSRPARQVGIGVRQNGSKRQVHAAIIPRETP